MTEAESRALFALLSEGASIAAIGYDPDLRVRWLNPAARTLLPLPSDIDPIGRSYSELGYPGEWSGQFREWFDRARGTDKPFFREVTLPGPNGPIRLRGGASPVIVDDELLGFVALAMDVTEFHRSAEQLAESEQRHHRIVREAGVFTWEHDHRTGRTRLEPEYLKRIGLTPQTIPENTDAWEAWFLTDEDREAARRAIADCERDQASSYEYDFRARDEAGQLRWFHVRAMPRRDAIGRTLVTEGVTIDITERHAALTALADTRALFDRFMEHCPALAWIKGPDFRYEYLNPEYERRFNLEGGTGVGRTDFDIFPRDVAEIFREHDASVLSSGLPISVTENTRDAKGRTQPWFVVKFPLPGDGDRAGVGGFAFDVSELHRLQEEQRAVERKMLDAQKLESIGVLAGGIAHDFNNILAGIIGWLGVARPSVLPGTAVKECFDNIERSSLRARDLVRQILAFSRTQEAKLRSADVAEVAEGVGKLLRASAPRRVQIEVTAATGLPPANVDPTELHHVLLNLGTNAVQAIGQGSGSVTLRVTRAEEERGKTASPPPIRIVVEDNGCGIPEEVLPRIFDPFFTTKAVGQGSGLGLSVAHGIVKSSGGSIAVQSKPGAGSTFTVLLPASAEARPAPAPAPAPPPPSTATHRIVLVDDEPAITLSLALLLRRDGNEVVTFHKPADALAAFQKDPQRFDLLLTDFSMPQMNGLELAAAVHAVAPSVPIIMMSGYAQSLQRDTLQAAGIAKVLDKPVEGHLLFRSVTQALRREPITD